MPFGWDYLHSNMFLLFLKRTKTETLAIIIYIPICFYYFRVSNHIYYEVTSIYIPICFYYFREHVFSSRVNHHLHSNMFLLFPLTDNVFNPELVNLHSNMFLLFRVMKKNQRIRSLSFTFQYVSIISESFEGKVRGIIIYIPICFYYFI